MRTIATLILLNIAFSLHAQTRDALPTVNMNKAVPVLYDSIIRSGVDTILLLRKDCKGCNSYAVLNTSAPATKPISEAAPAYFLWKKNGKYYAKKIDQFGTYRNIERASYIAFPVFDYYFRNADSINYVDKNNLSAENRLLQCAPKPDASMETNYSEIKFKAKADTCLILVNSYDILPVCYTQDKYFSNAPDAFYRRSIEKRMIWLRMTEAMLFETEFKHLWVRE